MAGRKPVPTALKIIQGNPGKRPLPKDEPIVAPSCPKPPTTLSASAKKHWRLVVKQLSDAKIMTDLDIDAMSVYCELYAQWQEANEQIRKFGMVVKNPQGHPTQSPFLRIADRASDKMKGMLTEFGMTPSSRARVKAIKDESSNSDPWADL